MAFLGGLFSGGASGEESEEEFQFFEYQWDFDQRGIIADLALQHATKRSEKKRRGFPVEVTFCHGEEAVKEELVMGYPHEVYQWAVDAVAEKDPVPRIVRTSNLPMSSMTIEFQTHAVMPNFYTIQHGWNTSFYALRFWVFEAQDMDTEKWFVVSEHKEKPPGPYSFREAHQTASFPVRGKFFAKKLRIRQTGLNSGGFDDLYLSGFEVYGKRRPLTESESYGF
eukprot:TRINITY_DN20129_c0_g1_i2.p1 TRINITY_DN20129_c0_g1~~TRINITY_DN20129_c0_g1_i2.p1  ORF type:complete len:224 (+),score=43.91 TRINITY_DN20129_c0_g1_i2:136-807(+)